MNNFVQNISIASLHGRGDIELALRPGLNIVHGRNGAGKSTLLHVLANLIDGDIERFAYLSFERIALQTSAGSEIVLGHISDGDRGTVTNVAINGEIVGAVGRGEATPQSLRQALRNELGERPIYLPAFRSVLEATTRPITPSPRVDERNRIIEHELGWSNGAPSHIREAIVSKTIQCREWFGMFVPIIRFPSLQEVEEQLDSEVYAAQLAIGETDRQTLAAVFVDVLKAIVTERVSSSSETFDELLQRVRQPLSDLRTTQSEDPGIYGIIEPLLDADGLRQAADDVRPILDVYARALEKRAKAQEAAFNQIRVFERSVNKFFEQKRLTINFRSTKPVPHRFKFPLRRPRQALIMLGDKPATLSVLSSGERQILTLLFSATHMSSGDGMVLIDEPELSLNIEWQRDILSELMLQTGERQIVVCTHSPEIAADHRDRLFELIQKTHIPTQPALPETELPEDED